MPPDKCPQAECIKKFAVLETQMKQVIAQNAVIIRKIDGMCPSVRENSWWIEKIKWGFVMIAVGGFVMGVVSWIRG